MKQNFTDKPCWIKHGDDFLEQQGSENWREEEDLIGLILVFPFKDDKYNKWTTNWRVGISAPGKYWYQEHNEHRIIQKKIDQEEAWTKVFVKHIPSGSSTTYCLWRKQDIKKDMTINGFEAHLIDKEKKDKWFTVIVKNDKTVNISIMQDRWDKMLERKRGK